LKPSTDLTHDESEPGLDDWYLKDDFWRNFGSLMFNEDTFIEAAEQVEALLGQLGGSGGRILDLGCGPGRHALPLAAQGYPVTAVDTSPTLLTELESRRDFMQKEMGTALDIEIIHGDMREFQRPNAFDLVLVMWTSFGYFKDEADHDRVLDQIHTSLASNGRVLLDLVGLEYLSRHLQPVHLSDLDDGRVLIERPVLVDDLSRLENDWMLIDGDQVHRTQISHRVWSAAEIRAQLARHGLETEIIQGGYYGEDYDLDAERLIVIARKID